MKTAYINPSQFGGLPMVDISIYKNNKLIISVNCIEESEAIQTATNEKAEIIKNINEDDIINQKIIYSLLRMDEDQRKNVLDYVINLKNKT